MICRDFFSCARGWKKRELEREGRRGGDREEGERGRKEISERPNLN